MSLGTGNVLLVFQTAAAGSAGEIICVTRGEVTQRGTATTAMVGLAFQTRNTAGTLTTTSTTPAATQALGGAASGLSGNTSVIGGTARSGSNSSADSGGAYTLIRPFDAANLNGYLWKPDGYGEQLIVPPSTVLALMFLAAPGTTTGWTAAEDLDEWG